jgi:ketosteroid isomerase-like protein
MSSRNMEVLLNLIGGTEFKKDRTSEEFQKEMFETFDPDIEVHEPPCFPHGGVHKGRESWFRVRKIMTDTWDQKLDIQSIWEVPDADVIVLNYDMDWTAKSTGRNVKTPAHEELTFRDGRIVKIRFFPMDAKAIADTLD